MTDPFRDAEATALARVEDLESENQRLREELEVARNLAGTNHQAYVKNLEDQLHDLKRDNAALETRLSVRASAHLQLSQMMAPEIAKSQERITYAVLAMFALVAVLATLLVLLLR